LLDAGDRVLVAVSGGADSVALLRLLLSIQKLFTLDLLVAHLNHNLRGVHADGDEQFVRQLAETHRLAFHSAKIPDSAVSARRDNLEKWARKFRYDFLSRCAMDHSVQKIALGHTMNDQAETLLMRLIRGSGTEGLAAIPPMRNNLFIRPLLDVERTELQAYLKEEGQTWREDGSNADTRHLRNQIRHQLLVELKDRYNLKIIPALARAAEILRDDAESARCVSSFLFKQHAAFDGLRVTWDVKRLQSYPVGLQRNLIRYSVSELGVDAEPLSFKNIDSILELLEQGKSGRSFESNAIRCSRQYHWLIIERAAGLAMGPKYCYRLSVPSELQLRETGSRFRAGFDQSPATDHTLNRWNLFLTPEELKKGFFIRNWEPGDSYFPQGFGSVKNVTDLLARRRVPKRTRAFWPVITLGQEIICVKDFPLSTDRVKKGQADDRVSVILEERLN
jgi:tRNA(Ile)-lysidine synthase